MARSSESAPEAWKVKGLVGMSAMVAKSAQHGTAHKPARQNRLKTECKVCKGKPPSSLVRSRQKCSPPTQCSANPSDFVMFDSGLVEVQAAGRSFVNRKMDIPNFRMRLQ